ncbi:EthD domain-containing protein [Streptomyces sp. NPDC026672]|uniref:EthD domain-containing protein n=1 Tax=unclassified Streptomyces TaxID=2593676 RepID=UPI0033FA6C35
MTAEGRQVTILLLRAKDGLTADAFRTGFTVAAGEVVSPRQRWSVLIERGDREPVPHETFMKDGSRPADAVVLVAHDGGDDAAADAVRAILARVEPLVEAGRTEPATGTEVVILPGYAPVYVMMQNRRTPGLTHDAHIDAWYGRHAQLGEGSGVAGYRQYHVLPDASARLSGAVGLADAGYDGVACSYFPDLDAAVRLMSGPLITEAAIPDEKTFIDHARSTFGFYTDVRADER